MPYFQSRKSAATLLAEQFPTTALSAMVEIADRCNETCVHCYQVQGQRGELPTDDWKRIFDELAEMGILFLTISGGEATLRRDFLDLVAYAREKHFAVKLFTNGLSMTRELAGELARLAVQEVQISLYSHRAEAHDWVTGVPGSWERTVAGVRHLREVGVYVMVKTPLMQVNQHEFRDFVAFAAQLGVDYSMAPVVHARQDGSLDPMLMAADAAQVRALRDDPRFGGSNKPAVEERPLSARPCGACQSVHVEADGELRPCTALSVPVGHALRDGIRNSRNQNPTAALIKSLSWGDLVGCRLCDLRKYCTRCFSDAQLEGHDALAPYLSACEGALSKYERVEGTAPSVSAGEGASRPLHLGPFEWVQEGRFRQIEEALSERDERLRAEHPWIRPSSSRSTSALGAERLVQLRRPGRRQPVTDPMPVLGHSQE